MRRVIKTIFCAAVPLLVCLASQAQTWRALVLQKTKAAQTIEAIKANVLQPKGSITPSLFHKRRQKQIQEEFAHTVKQAYPFPETQHRILKRYQELSSALHSVPALQNYALTIQHPADLYTASSEEIQILKDILLSFNTPQNPCPFTPYQSVEFASGAAVISFLPKDDANALHFAFKPQENILKIAVGDFPLSQQEFGPIMQKSNEE